MLGGELFPKVHPNSPPEGERFLPERVLQNAYNIV